MKIYPFHFECASCGVQISKKNVLWISSVLLLSDSVLDTAGKYVKSVKYVGCTTIIVTVFMSAVYEAQCNNSFKKN